MKLEALLLKTCKKLALLYNKYEQNMVANLIDKFVENI